MAYVESHPQFVAWLVLLGLAYLGMMLWMVFQWKDHRFTEALGPQLVLAKIGA